jgi:hypothetical protein
MFNPRPSLPGIEISTLLAEALQGNRAEFNPGVENILPTLNYKIHSVIIR